MKGYDNDVGYMGYIPNKGYNLFSTETEYYEYLEESEEKRNEKNI
jgi:hypothetical protein